MRHSPKTFIMRTQSIIHLHESTFLYLNIFVKPSQPCFKIATPHHLRIIALTLPYLVTMAARVGASQLVEAVCQRDNL